MAVRQKSIGEDEKRALLQRMEAGENVGKLAKEVGISRQRLYDWRDYLRLHRNLASRRRGRPPRLASSIDEVPQLQSAVNVPSSQEKALKRVLVPVRVVVSALNSRKFLHNSGGRKRERARYLGPDQGEGFCPNITGKCFFRPTQSFVRREMLRWMLRKEQ
ncbi:helix-turn-helix domain-containing protein [Ochrobactrum sp. MC-1LL]|uniref:helix-turn-helix domain-containing protein n=1 Tax=Ochrobactrum sp. MC-1LL TaxID=2735351 RepID=UPI00143840D9|nr:helix-turn-helix domain-containing protein [Ochrobactrum sp. MC-1LL]NKE74211.1 helix-turn-helix domain-containing protein [Ochrobactrum sp. MC-1LL]